MAHTKAKGSTKLGRDSESKRLGVKMQDGEKILAGQIVIRQRGTKFYPGHGVRRGGDDTLYAASAGTVKFTKRRKVSFDGSKKSVNVVSVL